MSKIIVLLEPQSSPFGHAEFVAFVTGQFGDSITRGRINDSDDGPKAVLSVRSGHDPDPIAFWLKFRFNHAFVTP